MTECKPVKQVCALRLSSVLEILLLELETLAEVFLPYYGVDGKLLGGTLEQDAALKQQVGAVCDAQGLMNVMVSYENAYVAVL